MNKAILLFLLVLLIIKCRCENSRSVFLRKFLDIKYICNESSYSPSIIIFGKNQRQCEISCLNYLQCYLLTFDLSNNHCEIYSTISIDYGNLIQQQNVITMITLDNEQLFYSKNPPWQAELPQLVQIRLIQSLQLEKQLLQLVLPRVPQVQLPQLPQLVKPVLQLVLRQLPQLVKPVLPRVLQVQLPRLVLLRVLQVLLPQLVLPQVPRVLLHQLVPRRLLQVLRPQLALPRVLQVPLHQLVLPRLLQAVQVQVQQLVKLLRQAPRQQLQLQLQLQQQQIHVSISGNLLWNKTGITVIGSSSSLVPASGVFVDLNDTLYATDETTHYVVWRLLKNAVNPTIVAGTSGSQGSSSTQLNFPNDVYIDRSGNIYVTDCNNHRVQKFNSGSNIGVTIAGTGSAGSALNQLNLPRYLTFDSTETYMYIADYGNHRVMRYSTSSTSGTNGVLIAG
ncbi:unnamed protein product, partial [Adineta steineri]